ncbi:MAG: histidine phosphatase family protein [bacterium]|nr:histidine phosphatase family protein [bacterium]
MNRILSILLLTILAALCLAFTSTRGEPEPAGHDTRVIYVVRHSEKADGDNPPLSEAGIERTERLQRMLAQEPLAAVYVTQTARSLQTGEPIAEQHGIDTTAYSAFGYTTLRRFIRELPEDSNALVVAHTNTVSPIFESLGAEPIGDIPDEDYSRLYAIILQDGVYAKTIRLTF